MVGSRLKSVRLSQCVNSNLVIRLKEIYGNAFHLNKRAITISISFLNVIWTFLLSWLAKQLSILSSFPPFYVLLSYASVARYRLLSSNCSPWKAFPVTATPLQSSLRTSPSREEHADSPKVILYILKPSRSRSSSSFIVRFTIRFGTHVLSFEQRV